MKKFISLFVLATGLCATAYGITPQDRVLLQKYALQNVEVATKLARTRGPSVDLSFLSNRKDDDGCIAQCTADCQGGAGSAACWQHCTVEGNDSETCAPRCGVSTSAGSQACWQKCGIEGSSSDVCAPRCGTTTAAGSVACWQRCGLDGYSSDVCAPRCGISTPEGSQACWQKCSLEDNSSDVCADRCGHVR
jgi:hypothetical protein